MNSIELVGRVKIESSHSYVYKVNNCWNY